MAFCATRLALAALIAVAVANAQPAPPAAIGGGGSALFNALGSDDGPDARLQDALSRLPPNQRQAFTVRLARKKDFHPVLTPPKEAAKDDKLQEIFGARQKLERAAFTLTMDQWAAPDAADFAASIPIRHEWEGSPEGPMAEAQAAKEHLERNPGSSVKDFVQLFLMHRFRCAFEAAEFTLTHEAGSVPESKRKAFAKQNQEIQREAAKSYREAWDRIRNSRDLATAAVASDIDTQRFIYIAAREHPRTFNK